MSKNSNLSMIETHLLILLIRITKIIPEIERKIFYFCFTKRKQNIFSIKTKQQNNKTKAKKEITSILFMLINIVCDLDGRIKVQRQASELINTLVETSNEIKLLLKDNSNQKVLFIYFYFTFF